MSRNKIIKIRISEQEYAKVKEADEKRVETVSEYIRSRLDKELTKKWIKKTEVQQFLSRIERILDKYEEKNAGLVQHIREAMKGLWDML
jgi:hypothetical protein